MGAITSLFEKRSTAANPAPWFTDWATGGKSSSGATINESTALSYPPFWAAINVISGAVGTLPLLTYRRLPKGKERAPKHPAYVLLHDRSNPAMDALTFRETLQAHVLTWGNGYAEIQRDGAGNPVALWPLRPDKTAPVIRNGKLWYKIEITGKETVYLDADDTLHIRGLGFDGYQGYSVVSMFKESLGLGVATEKFGAAFFGNGSSPSGVLEHPASLDAETHKRLRNSWEEQHTGLDNAQRVAILEEGMKWTQIGVPPDDAQFLETRRFEIGDVARMFQVPLHMLGDLERATFSNIEHQGQEFVRQTLMRWLKRWELECSYKLISAADRTKFFTEFLLNALLRGDTKSRYEVYALGRTWGILSINDVRAMENMNPIENGDDYLVPLNMTTTEKLGEEPEPPPIPPPVEPPPEPEPDENSLRAHQALLYSLCERIVTKQVKALQKALKKPDTFDEISERFWCKYPEHICEVLSPAIGAVAEKLGTERALRFGHNFLEQFAADYTNECRLKISEAPDKTTMLAAIEADSPSAMAAQLIEQLGEAHAPADTQ